MSEEPDLPELIEGTTRQIVMVVITTVKHAYEPVARLVSDVWSLALAVLQWIWDVLASLYASGVRILAALLLTIKILWPALISYVSYRIWHVDWVLTAAKTYLIVYFVVLPIAWIIYFRKRSSSPKQDKLPDAALIVANLLLGTVVAASTIKGANILLAHYFLPTIPIQRLPYIGTTSFGMFLAAPQRKVPAFLFSRAGTPYVLRNRQEILEPESNNGWRWSGAFRIAEGIYLPPDPRFTLLAIHTDVPFFASHGVGTTVLQSESSEQFKGFQMVIFWGETSVWRQSEHWLELRTDDGYSYHASFK